MHVIPPCTPPSSLDWPLTPQCPFLAGHPHGPQVPPAPRPRTTAGNAGSWGMKVVGAPPRKMFYLRWTRLRPSSSSVRSKGWFSSVPTQCSADDPTYFTSMMWCWVRPLNFSCSQDDHLHLSSNFRGCSSLNKDKEQILLDQVLGFLQT